MFFISEVDINLPKLSANLVPTLAPGSQNIMSINLQEA